MFYFKLAVCIGLVALIVYMWWTGEEDQRPTIEAREEDLDSYFPEFVPTLKTIGKVALFLIVFALILSGLAK